MRTLTSEMTKLLEKLYNLRGRNSVVFREIDDEREEAVLTQDRTNLAKQDLEIKIDNLAEEERVLDVQGKKLLNALATIERDEFSDVLEKLNINFDPAAIEQQVENTLPEAMEKIVAEKTAAEDELVKVQNESDEALAKIDELAIRKEEAIANQQKLNEYFDLALSSSSNITRDEITSLLAKFDFDDEEQREAAKLLMFPEDGLFDYDESITGRPITRKSIGEVFHTARGEEYHEDRSTRREPVRIERASNADEKKKVVQEEPKEEVKKVETPRIVQEETPYIETAPLLENIAPEIKVEEKLNDGTPTKENLIQKLTELGFDYLDFTSNDFNKMLENYNEGLFARNVNVAKNVGVEKDIFNDNVELLYDKDLEAKIDMLVNIGKQPQDIYLNPSVLIKYSLGDLESAIRVLHESGLDPKNVPLMAY